VIDINPDAGKGSDAGRRPGNILDDINDDGSLDNMVRSGKKGELGRQDKKFFWHLFD